MASPQRRKTVSVRNMEREKYLAVSFIWKSLSSLHKSLVTVIARKVVTYGAERFTEALELERKWLFKRKVNKLTQREARL